MQNKELPETFLFTTKKEQEFIIKKKHLSTQSNQANIVSYDAPDWVKIKDRTKPPVYKEDTISLIGRTGWITVDSVTKDRSKALEKEKRVNDSYSWQIIHLPQN